MLARYFTCEITMKVVRRYRLRIIIYLRRSCVAKASGDCKEIIIDSDLLLGSYEMDD